MKMHARLYHIVTKFELWRKKGWCRSFLKSLKPSHELSLERKSKAQSLYGLDVYEVDGPIVLRLPELGIVGELKKGGRTSGRLSTIS